MQGGVIGGVCLLAFLLSLGRTEELEGLKDLEGRKDVVGDTRDAKEPVDLKDLNESEVSDDLKSEISLAVTESNSQDDDEERSGAMAHSSSYNYGGSPMSNAVAQSYSGVSASAYSDGYGSSSQSKATAVAGGVQVTPLSPFNPELSPYISPAPRLSQAEAQAVNDGGGSYGQGLNTYPYSPSYPYTSGLGPAQAQADTGSGFYQPLPIAAPMLNPYNQGLNSAQAQTQASDGFYQPAPRPIPSPILNPYNQGSTQAQAQADNGLYQSGGNRAFNSSLNSQGSSLTQPNHADQPIVEPISLPSSRYNKVSDSVSDFPSYPYNPSVSSAQANSVPYQPIPIPDPSFSPFEQFLVPYKGSRLAQIHDKNGAYQPIPIPDPNPMPYDSILVPYKGPNPAITQGNYEPYQSIPLPKHNPKRYNIHNSESFISTIVSSYPYPKAQGKNNTHQPVPIPISSPFLVPNRGTDSIQTNTETEINASHSNPFSNDWKSSSNNPYDTLRSGNNSPALDNDVYPNLSSKSGWDSYVYNRYPPSGPNPQLYTSGAEAAQAYADAKLDATGVVNPYSQGLTQYAVDYPSESPYRPGGFNPNESQGPFNAFASGQTSSIAFEDAKSRLILPFEYVFPNKMPGGENVVQCGKENEFHHFWSRGQDCLVCICLNEYGLLTPVCASCGGCNNPPPKLPEPFPRLPEPVPVRPVTPEPFEPVPIISEPYPPGPPEPNPPEPIPALYQPVPSPEPYPLYPEPAPPSPVPVLYPRPNPTLPPPPLEAMCNPLPSGQPFTNPLHPCQICICRESVASGIPDVQIHCKDNPQCIAPADVTTLPPIPDAPVPVPLPICEKFPEHVLFPHPTDSCKLCKCSKSLTEAGVPEQLITCYPHPDCIPKLEPITEPAGLVPPPLPIPIEPQKLKPYPEPEPTPIVPLREPFIPMEPVPLPEIVTVEPLPWPPITTSAPLPTTVPTPVLTPRPGPLPGPSPHESCRPYPPNQAFQHPWDECQLCICTEAFAVGMITVEVNCYTKPSCCIEPPDNLKPALPGYTKPYVGVSNAVNGIDMQSLPSGSQPGIVITTSNRPPIYSPYSPRPVNIYDPGSGQGPSVDTLPQPQGYPPPPFNRLPTDDKFPNLPPSYTYQPNYQSGYVNPQYSDYPPRLPAPTNTIGAYKPSNYGFPATYQYGKEDTVAGNAYPGPPGLYQPYDPRYQGASSPNAYPGVYQRNNYEIPSMYLPGQIRDGYGQIQTSAVPGPNTQNIPQGYLGNRIIPRSGNDGPEDSDDSQ